MAIVDRLTGGSAPAWLDRSAFPFVHRWLQLPAGRMHYVDEGAGDILLFVHGNPSWSFEYRKLIRHFSATHRCIALDHIGFGLSDKPWKVSYLPQFHAANFAAFVNALELDDVTLVVNDWGGPIALDWAVAHPQHVRRIVALNSWFFDVRDRRVLSLFSRIVGSAIGRWFCMRLNAFPRVLMKQSFGKPERLAQEVHAQYLAPFPSPQSRRPTWVFPRAIVGESVWLDQIWQRRDAIANLPVLMVWGMKDAAFAPLLAQWRDSFPRHRDVQLGDVGHSVAEEASERLIPILNEFLAGEAI